MLDIAFIREHAELVKEVAKNKRVNVDIDGLLTLDGQRKELQQKLDSVNQQKNELAAGKQGKPSEEAMATGRKLKEEAAAVEAELKEVEASYYHLLEQVPNVYSKDTPVGPDESANVVLRIWGEKPTFDFKPLAHWELGKKLGIIDSERAAKVSGSRFTYLKGPLAQLEFALIQFVLSQVTNKDRLQEIITKARLDDVVATPFIPIIPPVFMRTEVMQRMARLEPREDRYLFEEDGLVLVGSAEHTIGSMYMDEVLDEKTLPLRYLGFSTAFRREAGSYGKDVRGILRMHQFDKLEMESFSTPENALGEHHLLVAIQEHLVQALGIHHRVVQNATGDMGKPNARQIDIECWLPGENNYRETHSADYVSDYQARRLKTRLKRTTGGTELVHMNDATALAIGRSLIALMENNQQADGSITIPAGLHPYLPFTTITAA
jgi:seryl-tRNA synthetase